MFADRFKGHVAVVTGGASGIGRAVAERLLDEGASVCSWDKNERALSAISTNLHTGRLRTDDVDVVDPLAVEAAFRDVVDRWGQVDIVVHAAGIVGPTATDVTDYAVEDFARVVAVNLTGSFVVAREAARHMRPRRAGRIVLLASMAGKDGNPGMSGYAASKAGVIGLVKALGKELAGDGVTVNGLAPGVIATPMNAGTSETTLRYMIDKIPMGRIGTVDEVAAIICWICSDEASFSTGFVFDASGGRAVY